MIATWWETAEWLAGFRAGAGAKVYFVQGHEVYPWLPQARSRSTYLLPFHKIVVSEWLRRIMESQYGDANVDVVPNGVDHSIFYSPARGKQQRPTVGILYSPVPIKGVDVALNVLDRVRSRCPGLRVLGFAQETPSPPLPAWIEFSRDPSPEALRNLYGSCDVWLTASRSEGFNLTAMEAMACRTPVVATRTGWPCDAIVHRVNGACVDVDDATGLALETERLLCLSDSAWREVSEQAFATVRSSSWERSAHLFEQALERAVASAGA